MSLLPTRRFALYCACCQHLLAWNDLREVVKLRCECGEAGGAHDIVVLNDGSTEEDIACYRFFLWGECTPLEFDTWELDDIVGKVASGQTPILGRFFKVGCRAVTEKCVKIIIERFESEDELDTTFDSDEVD